MDDIADLVLTPFRDIVEKGRTAVQNAGDTQPMLKASQALLKEGERALKKIEPLCKKQFDDYGPNFIAALRDDDDFDAAKFTELQMQSRTAAPKIYDILLKMKLEAPVQFNSQHFMSQLSPPSSPHPMPTMLMPQMPPTPSVTGSSYAGRDSVSSSKTDSRSVGDAAPAETANEQLRVLLDKAFNTSNNTNSIDLMSPPMPPPDRALPMPPPPPPAAVDQLPPRPPSTNPWDIRVKTVASDDERPLRDGPQARRRPPVDPALQTPVDGQSPNSPFTSAKNFSVPRSNYSDSTRSSSLMPDSARSSGLLQEYTLDGDLKHSSLTSQLTDYSMSPTQVSRPRAPSSTTSYSASTPTIPEEMSREKAIRARSTSRPRAVMYSPMPYRSQPRPRQPSYPTTAEERVEDVKPGPRSDSLSDAAQPPISERRLSDAESLLDPNPLPVSTRPPAYDRRPSAVNTEQQTQQQTQQQPLSGLELARRSTGLTANENLDSGLIPGFSITAVAAKCTHCLYELDFKHVEYDLNKQEEGNYTKNGIGYRLRFLQKSHLHAKRIDDVMYACVFCIHTSRTLDQSDSTVFTSTAALFAHLARHPRPLPDVPGIAVVDQTEVPPHLVNDYDLLFNSPPEPHPVRERAAELAHLPTGHAKESARRLFGQRLLPDRTPALELIQGAKITGLTWPARYGGEWAFGWHDGVFASIPVEILKLDRPPFSQIKRNNSSRVRAKARWKFSVKEKNEDWLKFDKDEVITNISWPYPEYWCWSGTNAKGKWGVFPQAFLDPNSLQEISSMIGSDRSSILSNEKNKSSTMLPSFSTRSKNGRPPSVAGSTSSGE
ncbi:hypothetical protein TRIATDRAFT_172578, partial [Trichoderma atroviride IMI 206040]